MNKGNKNKSRFYKGSIQKLVSRKNAHYSITILILNDLFYIFEARKIC